MSLYFDTAKIHVMFKIRKVFPFRFFLVTTQQVVMFIITAKIAVQMHQFKAKNVSSQLQIIIF